MHILPKVFQDPQYGNMLGNPLPVASAQQRTENDVRKVYGLFTIKLLCIFLHRAFSGIPCGRKLSHTWFIWRGLNILNLYASFLPKYCGTPKKGNMLGNPLPVGPAQQTTENYLK